MSEGLLLGLVHVIMLPWLLPMVCTMAPVINLFKRDPALGEDCGRERGATGPITDAAQTTGLGPRHLLESKQALDQLEIGKSIF